MAFLGDYGQPASGWLSSGSLAATDKAFFRRESPCDLWNSRYHAGVLPSFAGGLYDNGRGTDVPHDENRGTGGQYKMGAAGCQD